MSCESAARPELWAGVECTVNRVGDRYHDQLRRSGHLERLDDIERAASLGVRALRVPVLWERSCTSGKQPDFAWVAPMLRRVDECGVRPIAGLVHHGSGPRSTNLLEPCFATGLGRYAGHVARRFPHLRDYTPVNEPLTTARFSALYGHWYPHRRDVRSFLRALVHECYATLLAMRAIREVRSDARLIQTEDMATVRSTRSLAYQAEYENQRRFLSLDLLCGRVDSRHPLYAHLQTHGITDADLAPFLEAPCPPDVIGINYYFTSDRYLDEELGRHPACFHGGNGRHAYADVDAAHVPGLGMIGHEQTLRTVWERYRLPLAITEVHAGCTREEQLRWLDEAWGAACALRREQIPVQAVTAWALLGSYDWVNLVCDERGVYEPGVYDLRGAEPRPTALAQMVRALAHTGSFEHPVLASRGWWHRARGDAPTPRAAAARPVLIVGARGALGRAFARSCAARGLPYVLLRREQLDLCAPESVREALQTVRPWAVINAAGIESPELAEAQPALCRAIHVRGPQLLADACLAHGAKLLTFSSDQVFDGARDEPYLESDPVAPLSVYGRSQEEAERTVLAIDSRAFVVRTSSLFGSGCDRDRLSRCLHDMVHGRGVHDALHQTCSPTYVPHLVEVCLDLLVDGAEGRWHLTSEGEESWTGLLGRIAVTANRPFPCPPLHQSGSMLAPRPGYSVLRSEHGAFMPSLESAIACYLRTLPDSLASLRAA